MTRSLAPRRTLRRGLAAAALTPLLLGGFVACGDNDSDAKSSDTKGSNTSQEAPAAGSAVLTGLEKGDEVDADKFVDTVSDGMEKSTTAHVTMTMTGDGTGGMKGEGDIDYTGDAPAMTMSMSIPGVGGEQKMILVDGIMYMQSAQLGGDKYIKIDPSDPNSPLAGAGLDKTLKQADPAGQLESMRQSIQKVSYVGEEKVDGRDLDHYELTLDMQKAMKEMGANLPSAAASAVPETISYDIWLDDEDRFAQMEMAYPIMGKVLSMKMTADDWGKDVTVKAPPADQVQEMPDLGSLGGGTGSGA